MFVLASVPDWHFSIVVLENHFGIFAHFRIFGFSILLLTGPSCVAEDHGVATWRIVCRHTC